MPFSAALSMSGTLGTLASASVDWNVLHALNDFLFHHDGVEDPLLFYVNISEALFVV